jgi:hypothetical protein
MKIYTNERLVRRNSRLGQIASLAGLLVLVGGMYISFRYQDMITIAWVALLIGFALSQLGLYYGNRWGRRPRPDEHLSLALKSLDDRHSVYHYMTPVPHFLVGPSGLWVLIPFHQIGKITYEKGRWKQKGGNIMQRYLRLFAQEGIGRPELDAPNTVQVIKRYLKKNLPDVEFPEPQPVLVFTSEKIELETNDAPIPTVPLKKLKEVIRKTGKEAGIDLQTLKTIQEFLTPPNEA